MWSLLVLLMAVLNVDCYYTTRERLSHGRRLSIKLSKETDRLEFVPEDGSPMETIWRRGQYHASKGRVTGGISSSSFDQFWELQRVVFEDKGTYILKDFWNKETKSILLDVTTEHKYIDRVAGEDLGIDLEGSNHGEATLVFSGEAGNFTLVRDGNTVGNDLADYADRVRVSSSKITISHVNTSDVGRYRLYDRKDRLVSVTKMRLVDAHEEGSGNPLLALLLLLGIPAGVCCCCRKRIFRKKAATTSTHVIQSADQPSWNPVPSSGPGGQAYPDYPAAGGPIPHPQNPGYGQPVMPPGVGFQPGYDSQNPVYPPPPGPGMPPQWNGPPPYQYNPAAGPPGIAPVAYSAPPPNSSEPPKEEIKMNEMPPSVPLLTPPAPQNGQVTPSVDALNTSDTAAKFQIDAGNTNFL